jgi:hypothetical protein
LSLWVAPLPLWAEDFAARYCPQERALIDELQQHYKLPRADFHLRCNPIEW